jgi:tRNA threonylcarbamoyladenosine biosynthesis protein TsaE
MSIHITTRAQDTELLGFQLAILLNYEEYPIVLLDGPLAAGKTTFTKGIASALGIRRNINSPSYTLMKMYHSEDLTKQLYHFDLYRMEPSSQDFDLEEYINAESFTVIEWPYQVPYLLPEKYVKVTFEMISESNRKIEITCHAPYCEMLENKL